jgi:parallel beta-helix repeat protein
MDITGGRLQYMLERLNTSSTVNVETFGAVGDGVTDDTVAIQAALDLAHTSGGGLIQFTPGKTYAVTNFLVVYDYTTIYAYGATIKSVGNTGILRNFLSTETFSGYGGHSHIQVLGGTWDGNAFNGTNGSVTAETNVMGFIHCEDITVRDARIMNVSSAHGIEFNSTDGGRALNCLFLGYRDNTSDASRTFSEAIQIDLALSGSAAIGLFDNTPSKNILVDGCKVGASTRCGSFGRGVGSHKAANGVYYYGIQIVNNRFDDVAHQGVYGFAWRRVVIANNIVFNSGLSGIQLSRPDPVAEGYSANGKNVSITGNTIDSAGDDSGIRVYGATGATWDQVAITGNSVLGLSTDTSNGIHVEFCSRPTVTGNTINGTASTGIVVFDCSAANVSANTIRNTGSNGVNVSRSNGTNVNGNSIDTNTTNHGVFIADTANFLVQNNYVTNVNAACIRLSDGATKGLVANNRIIKGTSVNGITVSPNSASGNTVANNDLTNNGWTTAVALVFSTAATTSFGGGTTSPGYNIVS